MGDEYDGLSQNQMLMDAFRTVTSSGTTLSEESMNRIIEKVFDIDPATILKAKEVRPIPSLLRILNERNNDTT